MARWCSYIKIYMSYIHTLFVAHTEYKHTFPRSSSTSVGNQKNMQYVPYLKAYKVHLQKRTQKI